MKALHTSLRNKSKKIRDAIVVHLVQTVFQYDPHAHMWIYNEPSPRRYRKYRLFGKLVLRVSV
jgi:hypothetical protein